MNAKIQKISLERIYRLFELAEQNMESHPERTKRYIELARKIGTRNNARFPKELKDSFCKKCNAFLKKGKTAEHKTEKGLLVIKCIECGFERKTRSG